MKTFKVTFKECEECGVPLLKGFNHHPDCSKTKRGRPKGSKGKASKPLQRKKDVRLYVISSSKFKTLKDAKEQMFQWLKNDSLDPNARIYEVKRCYRFRVITDVLEENWKK